MLSEPTDGSDSREPSAGWADATPYGAPWPHDQAQVPPSEVSRPHQVLPPGQRSEASPQPAVQVSQSQSPPHAQPAPPPAQPAAPPAQHHPVTPGVGGPPGRPYPDVARPASTRVRRRFGWAGLVVAGAVVVAALFAVTGYGELADHPDAS